MNLKITPALGFFVLTLSAVCHADQAVPEAARERFWNENAVVYAAVLEHYLSAGNAWGNTCDLEVLATVAGTLDSSLLGATVRTEPGPAFAKKGDRILAFVTRTDKGTLDFVPSVTGIFPSRGAVEIIDGLDDPKAKTILSNLRKLRAAESVKVADGPPPWLPSVMILPLEEKAGATEVFQNVTASGEKLSDGGYRIRFAIDGTTPWLNVRATNFTVIAKKGDNVPLFGRVFKVSSALVLSNAPSDQLPPGAKVDRHSLILTRGGTCQRFGNATFTGMVSDSPDQSKARIEWNAPKSADGREKRDVTVDDVLPVLGGQTWRVINIVPPDAEKHVVGWIEFVRDE